MYILKPAMLHILQLSQSFLLCYRVVEAYALFIVSSPFQALCLLQREQCHLLHQYRLHCYCFHKVHDVSAVSSTSHISLRSSIWNSSAIFWLTAFFTDVSGLAHGWRHRGTVSVFLVTKKCYFTAVVSHRWKKSVSEVTWAYLWAQRNTLSAQSKLRALLKA